MKKLGSLAFVTLGLIACTADPYGDLSPTTKSKPKSAKVTCSTKPRAEAPAEGRDPTTLKTCKGTKGVSGRCVERSSLGSFADTFEQATCGANEGCVPDEVVKAGQKIELKKCTAVLDAEGRCFWPLAKDIVDNYDLLKGATKDQCAADQVCAPCVNPLNSEETGLCTAGGASGGDGEACVDDSEDGSAAGATTKPAAGGKCPQVEPIVDASKFPVESCGTNMVCVEASLAGDNAKSLKTCGKSGVCAPKKAVERAGNYVPATCRSTAGAEGRCTNIGVPQVAEQKDTLPQDTCDKDERCAPCFDPRDGKETGACRTASCDAPKEKAKQFATCCGGRARCVPSASVPADSRESLAAESCKGTGELCAPVETIGIPNTPLKACSAMLGLVTGICVSACAAKSSFSGFLQGDCAEGDFCAPCSQLPAGTCK